MLETSVALPDVSALITDRFIANELEIINNYDTRERYAKAIIDSFDNTKDKSVFKLLKSEKSRGINGHKSVKDLTEVLKYIISADQKGGMDIIEISAESPSAYEAALIANTCAVQYKEINLEANRTQLLLLENSWKNKAKKN